MKQRGYYDLNVTGFIIVCLIVGAAIGIAIAYLVPWLWSFIKPLIHAHCRAHIKHAWHWSSESFEEDALRAGCCNFNYGYRGGEIKSFEFCAVAVRRIPIGGEL